MLQKIKVIVRSYLTKEGRTFSKISLGGKFVPDVLADENANYRVMFTKKSEAEEPKEEGIYEVAYEEGNLWIDTRPELADKNIVRIIASKVKFYKPLPKLEKDVRAQ